MTDPTATGTNALIAKALGWLQFAATTLGSVFVHGIPVGIGGWLGVVGSLAAAVGIHAASSTDGSK